MTVCSGCTDRVYLTVTSNEDRASRVTHDLLCDRTEEHARDSGSSVASHHDEIDRWILIELGERLRAGIAKPALCRDLDAFVSRQASSVFGECLCPLSIELALESHHRHFTGRRHWN